MRIPKRNQLSAEEILDQIEGYFDQVKVRKYYDRNDYLDMMCLALAEILGEGLYLEVKRA